MTLNAQLFNNYLRQPTFFEDLALPETSSLYRSMDPFKFFENNLMREILLDSNDSDDHEVLFAKSAVSRSRRLPYAKFSASSPEEAALFSATRPNSHDVSDNDEQTSQGPAPVAPVVDMRARRPPGNLSVVNRPKPVTTNMAAAYQQRVPNRRKLTMKRHMDRVFGAQYDEQNPNCMISLRVRNLNSSNIAEFILDH
jgi:hypothetical protein